MDNVKNENSSPPIQTETMAQLLLNQRHWREAIDIYHKLGRQNPEKSAEYQKKILEIKEYFKPQLSPEANRKIKQTRNQINHLKKLLLAVRNQ
jgi:outer membrane protein assembly factor BamD (BamD/ComL family)